MVQLALILRGNFFGSSIKNPFWGPICLRAMGGKKGCPQTAACYSCPSRGAVFGWERRNPLYSRIAPRVGNVSLDEVREQFVCQQHFLHPDTDI